MPKISIIIPVYNLENYIERTVDSVLTQSFRDLEVIAVNDGSNDNSADILNMIAERDGRFKVIHKENGGVTSARVTGITMADGDYIGFVDGDDLIDNNMFERLILNALRYDADISHCGYRVITPSGETKYYYNTGKLKIQDNSTGITDLLKGEIIEPGLCNKLYKRELMVQMLKSGKLDTSLVINEDLLMNYYLFRLSNKSVYEDICPYQYIKRNGSASQSNDRLIDYEHPIRVRQAIVNDCKGTPEEKLSRTIYISKTLHKLSDVLCKDSSDFDGIKEEMYSIIKQNKDVIEMLPMKQRINGLLSIFFPRLFEIINKIYRARG